MSSKSLERLLAEIERLNALAQDMKEDMAEASPAHGEDMSDGGPPPEIAELLSLIDHQFTSQDAKQQGMTAVLALVERKDGKDSSMVACVSESGLEKTLVSDEDIANFANTFANPARLKILRALVQNAKTSTELSEATGLVGGQLYHHLKELMYSGIVVQPERNSYLLSAKTGRTAYLGLNLLVKTITQITSQAWGEADEHGDLH